MALMHSRATCGVECGTVQALHDYVFCVLSSVDLCFFFFQAEDGIRDLIVTGVQTCALPILETLTSSDGVEAGITFGGRSVGLVICGRRSTPPLAIAPIARASWMGVTATAPCPIPTEIVSPAYHFCLKLRIFHCSEGITPLTSCGRSTPVFCPNPNIVAYFAMRSIPNFSASV